MLQFIKIIGAAGFLMIRQTWHRDIASYMSLWDLLLIL